MLRITLGLGVCSRSSRSRLRIEFSLGLRNRTAGVVLRVVLRVRPELGNVAHDFVRWESTSERPLRVSPIALRLAQFLGTRWRCPLARGIPARRARIDWLGAKLEVPCMVSAVRIRLDGYAEVLLIFRVREARKAEYPRRVGRRGIAIEFVR